MNKKINKEKISVILYPILFGVILLLLWQTQLLHKILGADTFTLPIPSRINSIIGQNIPKIMENLKATMIVAISGLVLGSVIGYLLAIIATIFPKKGAGGLSIASALSAVPIVIIAPIISNLTKNVSDDPNTRSMLAKSLVVMVFCIVPMAVNAHRGLNELKPYSIDLLHSYAASKLTIFTKLRLPNSVPYIFTALRVTVPGCIISALVSEYFAEYVIGIGRQIRENIVTAQYSSAWAYIAIACLVGIVMYAILLVVESILLKWKK